MKTKPKFIIFVAIAIFGLCIAIALLNGGFERFIRPLEIEIVSRPYNILYIEGVDEGINLDGGIVLITSGMWNMNLRREEKPMDDETLFSINIGDFTDGGIHFVDVVLNSHDLQVSFPIQVISLEEVLSIIEREALISSGLAEPQHITIGGERFRTTLTELDLRNRNLVNDDLILLQHMANLKHLNLSGNPRINNLTPLANMTQLEQLTLDLTLFCDVTPLASLTNLTRLNLTGSPSDITPLSELVSLEVLLWMCSAIDDLSPLSSLTNLESLSLGEINTPDLTPLSELTNLKSLLITSDNLSDLTPLSNLVNLTRLGLFSPQISDLAPLAGLQNLSYLTLLSDKITDWTPVEHVETVNNLM